MCIVQTVPVPPVDPQQHHFMLCRCPLCPRLPSGPPILLKPPFLRRPSPLAVDALLCALGCGVGNVGPGPSQVSSANTIRHDAGCSGCRQPAAAKGALPVLLPVLARCFVILCSSPAVQQVLKSCCCDKPGRRACTTATCTAGTAPYAAYTATQSWMSEMRLLH